MNPSLDEVSDDRVLERVRWLVGRSNEVTAELLAYLIEVEERGLHLREATSSLFAFCVERLHLSESAAAKRIWAARTARRFPLARQMVARGEIHLSGLNLLAPHLTEENHAALLARAVHRTRREIEAIIAELAPRPDVPSRVAKVPVRATESAPLLALVTATGPVSLPAPANVDPRPRPALVAPLAPRRYQIRVTVGEETHAALCQLQDLLAHQVPDRDPAVIIARALDLLLERTLARKAAVTDRPRPSVQPGKRNRHIPAAVRREVWQRDGARCGFVDREGNRCTSTHMLEFHHVKNWARGAEHEASEIQLRCRPHNQYQAFLDYGPELIERHRGTSRAEEPLSRYGPARTFPAECPRPSGWSCPGPA